MPAVMSKVLVETAAYVWESFRSYVMALAVLTICSGMIRGAVTSERFGPTTVEASISPNAMWALLVLPTAFWLLSIWASRALEPFFMRAVDEDGWMEYGQAVLLLFGSGVSAAIARLLWKTSRRAWACCYLLLALALFWAMGEEISWGQRLLHLSTPAWFESHNVQQEMNLHNLPGVDDALSVWTDLLLAGLVVQSAGVWMTGLRRVRRLHTPLWVPHPSLIPSFCCVVSYGDRAAPL